MSSQPDQPHDPVTPQPAATPEALRAAVAQVAPGSLAAFDAERAEAVRQARAEVSAAPLRSFTGQWSVNVAIARHPARAARLRELEALIAQTDDLVQAREAAAEIGRILDAAFAEAGVRRGSA
ncbi:MULTISPECIES: DUF6247 family protein [Streptomyces]|uniref:Uncharacterized protein n=1 Tax=Streptomyces demainii TaxID=588122 RepID=A0ABT9KML0_9ACTN|nr:MULTISPECIES: DUF6247 family protein [Streptomyces]MBW8091912.1 hypothetical protein [Streptomyces hygroscopicus subsp. hygroscopicus]MCO8307951.1 hypothetical protein [Streptomyces sp. RKCA744]MDP9609655.1 hypothetical protein [Streptomyces demainii]